MALPWLITWPWFTSAVNGSMKSSIRMSCSTLTKNREYSRCRMACSTPPTYKFTGAQRRTASTSNGPCSNEGAQVGQQHRQLLVGHRHLATFLAVHDRNRRAPEPLPRQQPVAQPVVHRGA